VSVSVVIPCYNAERWIGEAIESCLAQSHAPDEVIVVDDGSTDDSSVIIARYASRVRHVRQDNAGAPRARNAGFALSRGEFIQFLDADDFLLPGKLEHQVAVLTKTGAAAVYGDWRHQFYERDGSVSLGEPQVSGAPPDLLEALIAGWWVSSVAIMFRRSIVEEIGGWDESLQAAQDRDFFQRVAMATEHIAYAPKCEAIYRRYGAVTVSTSCIERYARSHLKVARKIEGLLAAAGRLTPEYHRALARSYFNLARMIVAFDSPLAAELACRVRELNPDFSPTGNAFYALCYHMLGFAGAERFARLKRRLVGDHNRPGISSWQSFEDGLS
jgi:glycosyltransferase involved in cell wall biosynthesis